MYNKRTLDIISAELCYNKNNDGEKVESAIKL